MIRAAGVPALSGGSTRRPLLHRLQQTVHEIRRGRVRALHQASFHTLHYCIPLPESFGMMAMMQWIKESTCSSPAGKHRNASCSCGGCCRCWTPQGRTGWCRKGSLPCGWSHTPPPALTWTGRSCRRSCDRWSRWQSRPSAVWHSGQACPPPGGTAGTPPETFGGKTGRLRCGP